MPSAAPLLPPPLLRCAVATKPPLPPAPPTVTAARRGGASLTPATHAVSSPRTLARTASAPPYTPPGSVHSRAREVCGGGA
jgi:hypothetical protein